MTKPCRLLLPLLLLILALLAGCGPVTVAPGPEGRKGKPTQKPYTINGRTYYPIATADGYRERGTASWYGRKFHGRKTANGETYNMYAKTAAHKTLPMNTVLLVHNLDNGRETVVRVNDRGPFVRGRIIDLSYAAAKEIGMIQSGVARAEIIAMGEKEPGGGARPGRLRHPDFTKGTFYIQVGSFLNRANAEKLARVFLGRKIRTVIQPYITSGHTYYRVQIFAGTSLPAARLLEQTLLATGYSGAFIFAR
ncbi:MAG: septal ring lytic transglycosylase RlpA family protein [Desulfobulbaceae bacterium]